MDDKHWHQDEFLASLYGIGPDDGHLEECEECRRRWEGYVRRRKLLRGIPSQVPEEIFTAQRQAVRLRLSHGPERFRQRLVPALAFVLLVLVALTVFAPRAEQEAFRTESDDQLFEEVFTLVSSPVPEAVQPVRSLFEESQ